MTKSPKKAASKKKVYGPVIERVFHANYKKHADEVSFTRGQLENAAAELGVDPKNVGDVVYSFRYRAQLPKSIRERAPAGRVWIIRGTGAARYRFCAVLESYAFVVPREGLVETKIPDGTPGVIARYALDDEQALLAKVRYNRLIDIFLGVACYSLQSHLRTQVADIGQVETDEVYLGVDKKGAHYVIPVQAKGNSDRHSIVQVEQDIAMAREKWPMAICRPIAAQFIGTDKIALFSFEATPSGDAKILEERHYVLVDADGVSPAELEGYRKLSLQG